MAYNFVTLLPAQVRKGTVFYAFLGRWVDFTALGKGVDALLPACILLPVFLGLFDVYGKVARSLGFAVGDSEGYSDAEGPGVAEDGSSGFISTWTEGRQLIEQELNGPGALGLSSQYRDSVASARYKSSRGEGARGDVAARAGGLLPSSSSLSLLNATPAGADSSANAGARAGTAESTSAASSPRSRTFLSSAPNFLPFSATSNARPRSSHAFDRDRAGGVSSNIADTTLNATQRHGHRDGNDDGNDDDDSSNPIMAFAHRVRNTVETVSWPWQQQQQQHSHRRQESRAQNNMNQGPGSVWDRLFGGDAAAGGIRL
ncbi:hypothetical protein KEM52_003109 [Ascosphaera acerosa]|nr:hypothetical protein KEM52_003109 [Ascosphaera acerosa]